MQASLAITTLDIDGEGKTKDYSSAFISAFVLHKEAYFC